jgi:hypothetical protein
MLFQDGKLFGREPTLWVALIATLVTTLGTFGLPFLTGDQAGFWNAAIFAIAGVFTAWVVRPIAPAAFTYAIATIAQLAAAYNLIISPEQLVQIQALVVPALALLTRGQVSPVPSPTTTTTEAPTPEAREVIADRAPVELAREQR